MIRFIQIGEEYINLNFIVSAVIRHKGETQQLEITMVGNDRDPDFTYTGKDIDKICAVFDKYSIEE